MSVHLVLGLIVLAIAVAFVLAPLVQPRAAAPVADDAAAERRAARQSLYRHILEIEFDQQVGKVSAEDAGELTADLLRQAAALLGEEPGPVREADQARAQLEAEIAAVRRALNAGRRTSLEPAGR